MNQLKTANRNIKLYIFVRIFAKRVFLPLSAIYFMDQVGFTIQDIGLLAAFYCFIQLLVEVPTGYFADRVGRVASIRLGAISAAAATLIYVFFPFKLAIFIGAIFEALGYSFMAGSGEALIHDSLVIKKQEGDYTKILSRTMSISLIANALLISLVPLTYPLDPRYPFLLGTIAYLTLLVFALFMHDVPRLQPSLRFSLPNLSKIVGKRHILLFGLTFGIIAALYTAPVDLYNIALREYGISPEYLGWLYGAASIVGASIGPFIHHLQKIKLANYLLLDIFVMLSVYLAAYLHSAYLLTGIIILAISFWRYRKIIYQSYLLNIYPTSLKATLLSTMNNLEQLNTIWLPLIITYFISQTNISTGLGLTGLIGLLVAPLFYFSTLKFFARKAGPPLGLANQALGTV